MGVVHSRARAASSASTSPSQKWPPSQECYSLLEPVPGLGVLHSPYATLLPARSTAQLLLCTCRILRERHHGTAGAEALLRERRVGGGTAWEMSARIGHPWMCGGDGDASRALQWMEGIEGALWVEDFKHADLQPEVIPPEVVAVGLPLGSVRAPPGLPAGVRPGRWYLFGGTGDTPRDERCVGPAPAEEGHDGWEGARCASVRISRQYPDTPAHFGRGVTCWLPRVPRRSDQPSRLFFQVRVDIPEPPLLRSSLVGYIILSDTDQPGDQSLIPSGGRFGAELALLMFHVSAGSDKNDAMLQMYSMSDEKTELIPFQFTISQWTDVMVMFDWEGKQTFVLVRSKHHGRPTPGDTWPQWARIPSRSFPASALRRVSLLSVDDQGGAAVSWTDFVLT